MRPDHSFMSLSYQFVPCSLDVCRLGAWFLAVGQGGPPGLHCGQRLIVQWSDRLWEHGLLKVVHRCRWSQTKAEGASICALLIPSSPCLTDRHAWSHCMSLRSTFRILDRSDLRMLSKVARSGLSEQSAVCRRYSNFGMLRLLLSKTRASCEWTNDRRPKALFNWSILCVIAASSADPLKTGAPSKSKVFSSLVTFTNLERIDESGMAAVFSAMISHLLMLSLRPVWDNHHGW